MSAFIFENISLSRNDFSIQVPALQSQSANPEPAHFNFFFNDNTNYFQAAPSKMQSPALSLSACPSDMIDESLDLCLNAPLIKKNSSIIESKEVEVNEFCLRDDNKSFQSSKITNNNQYFTNFCFNSIEINDFSL